MTKFWPYHKVTAVPQAPSVRTSFPGSSLYFEKVPWLRLVTCLSIPTQAAQRVGPQLNFVNTRKVNVALLYGRYFEKEASYLSEILPGQLLLLYLKFYEYELLIERELCLITAFLNNCHQPVSE